MHKVDVRIELYMVCGLPTNDAIILAECMLEFLQPTTVIYNEVRVLANVPRLRIKSEAIGKA